MSTLEVLIAFAVLTLTLTAVILVVFGNQSISIDSQTSLEALGKAQAQLENARALSRQDFSQVVSMGPAQEGIYQKTLTVQSLDSYTKQAVSLVSWVTGGRSLSVSLSTILSDLGSLTESCTPTPTGDWKNPRHWDFVPSNLVPGNNSNGLGIADVKVYKQKMYIAANSVPNSGKSFFIFTLPDDPSIAPVYAGSVATNSSSDGLSAVVLGIKSSSLFAYAASARQANYATCTQGPSCAQLQIVDVTNAAAPSVAYSLKIPGVTGSGGQGAGKSIFYSNGYVYLGLRTGGGREFHIINVSNPLSPVEAGSYSVGRTVESIYVSGNYAYLATDDNASGNQQLLVLDISDKTNPHLTDSPVGGFLSVSGVGFGRAVFANATRTFLGRSYSSATIPTFYILDNTNPATYPSALPVLGSVNAGINDSVNSIVVRGPLAFLITNRQFQVWDISKPASPVPWSSDGTTTAFLSLSALGGTGTSLNCAGNYFYAAIASNQGNHKDTLSVIGPGPIN